MDAAHDRSRLVGPRDRRTPARYRPPQTFPGPRPVRGRKAGDSFPAGRRHFRQPAEPRRSRRLPPPQSARPQAADGIGLRRERRFSRVARPFRARRLSRELGRRHKLAYLVRHCARADGTLAPPATNPRGHRPARHPDTGAVSPCARLLRARPALRLPRRSRSTRRHRPPRNPGGLRRPLAAPQGRYRLDAYAPGRPCRCAHRHPRTNRVARLHQGIPRNSHSIWSASKASATSRSGPQSAIVPDLFSRAFSLPQCAIYSSNAFRALVCLPSMRHARRPDLPPLHRRPARRNGDNQQATAAELCIPAASRWPATAPSRCPGRSESRPPHRPQRHHQYLRRHRIRLQRRRRSRHAAQLSGPPDSPSIKG